MSAAGEVVVEGHEGWQPHLVRRGVETAVQEPTERAPSRVVVVEPHRVSGGQLNMRAGSLFAPGPEPVDED